MDIGNVMGALAVKIREAHEDRQVQQFHADMRRETQRRATYQAATPDPSKWPADAQQGAQAVAKPYENAQGVSPEVQHTLRAMAGTFKNTAEIQTRTAVTKRGFADTAQAYTEN